MSYSGSHAGEKARELAALSTQGQSVERLVHGGRTVTLPLIVNGEAAGALVIGPLRDEPSFFAIEAVRGYVDDATKELTGLWHAAK